MGLIKPGLNDPPILIDEFVDTAFDKVKLVGDNIEAIIGLAPFLKDGSFATLASVADKVVNVVTNVDAFNNIYYGSFAADPILSPDGSPISAGDMYFNSVSQVMQVFDGSIWVPFIGATGVTGAAGPPGADGADAALPPLSPWATVTLADLAFIQGNLLDDSIPSTKIEKLVASKIVAGTIAVTEKISVAGQIESLSGAFTATLGPKAIGAKNALLSFMNGPTPLFAVYDDGSAQFSGSIVITAPSSGFNQLTDKPTTLGELNTLEGDKLTAIEANATAGSTWGTNIAQQPIDSEILNYEDDVFGSYIPNPVGGRFSAINNPVGYIKITLPQLYTSTMLLFDVEVFNAADGTSFIVTIGGFNDSVTNTWLNTSAKIHGSLAVNHAIRFGHDVSKAAVWIGEATSVWAFPKIIVRNVRAGHNFTAFSDWSQGWAVSITPTLDTEQSSIVSALGGAYDTENVAGQSAATLLANVTQVLADVITAQSTADGKIVTYFQPIEPAGTLGDLWIDTDDGNKLYRHDGTSYVTSEDVRLAQTVIAAQAANDLADGKAVTYFGNIAPGAPDPGDLWYNSTTKVLARFSSGLIWQDTATFGADWSANVDNVPANLFALSGTENINNTLVTINTNGTLGGAGGGAVTPGGIGAETPLSAQAKADLAEANAQAYVDASFALTTTVNSQIGVLQGQIDNNITSWFLAGQPTLANAPANTWADDPTRNIHLGDLYYDTSNGLAYRFQVVATVYSWQQLVDSDIALALLNASKAQDTADSKRRVFTAQPLTSEAYDVGDLWDKGGIISRAIVAKTDVQLFDINDWIDIATHTTLTSQLTDDAQLRGATWGTDVLNQPLDYEILNYEDDVFGTYIPNPVGGRIALINQQTGPIKIVLPQFYTDTDIAFEVEVFSLENNGNFVASIAGKTNSTGPTWENVTVNIKGDLNAAHVVRFGNDTTNAVVWIGQLTTNWQFPKISVRNFRAGGATSSFADWATGWSVGVVSAFGTVDLAITDTLVSAFDTQNVAGVAAATVISDLATALAAGSNAQATVDGKITSFFQNDAPLISESSQGDLWIDLNDNNKLNRYDITNGWESTDDTRIAQAVTAAQSANTLADKKAMVFFNTLDPFPIETNPVVAAGDLWFHPTTQITKRRDDDNLGWTDLSTFGVTWGDATQIIGQPADAVLRNDLQTWNDITGAPVLKIAADSYLAADDGNAYAASHKVSALYFELQGGNPGSWPIDFGGVVTHWYETDRATQIVYSADNNNIDEWTRSLNPSGFPVWTPFRLKDVYSSSDVDALLTLNGPAQAGADVTNYADTRVDNNLATPYTLINAGGMAIEGSKVTKINPTGIYDSSVYSAESYVGGAFVSFVALTDTDRYFVALNSDPLGSIDFTTLDYSFFLWGSGNTLEIWVDGVLVALPAMTYAIGDVFAITYDGVIVKWFQNSVLRHSFVPTTSDLKLSLDTAYAGNGASTGSIQFGPFSSVTAIGQSSSINMAPVQYWASQGHGDTALIGSFTPENGVILADLGLVPGDTVTAAMFVTAIGVSDVAQLMVRSMDGSPTPVILRSDSAGAVGINEWVVVTHTIVPNTVSLQVRTNVTTNSFTAEKISVVRGFFPLQAIQDMGSQLVDPNNATKLPFSEVAEAATIQADIDNKIVTFWVPTAPGTATDGDLWFDTSPTGDNKLSIWNAGGWVPADDIRIGTVVNNLVTVEGKTDGKASTYFNDGSVDPTSFAPDVSIGDLWYNTTTKIIQRRNETNTGWEDVGNAFDKTSQLIDDANLADTALWPSITGVGKPADNADVTGNNTANDTNNVGGTPSATIKADILSAALSADWPALSNIPVRFNDAIDTGLNLTQTHMGYHDGIAWQSYIDNSGQFFLNGDVNNFLSWNGSVLSVRGDILASSLTVGSLVSVSLAKIGLNAGLTNQGVNSLAIGNSAGNLNQGANSIAIGEEAAMSNQGINAISIGFGAGKTTQKFNSIAIGLGAGTTTQGERSVAVGVNAGETNQRADSIGIGDNAGRLNQGSASVSVGSSAGNNTQGDLCVAIGSGAANNTQGIRSIAIGFWAGATTQGADGISIGYEAGKTSQGINTVAIGTQAGNSLQSLRATAIGFHSGLTSQSTSATAIGTEAGLDTQGLQGTAIGNEAGKTNQGFNSTAIGHQAGMTTQASQSVAIGAAAGTVTQATTSVAIGAVAGNNNQGAASTAIGYLAGFINQPANSTCLGANTSVTGANQVQLGDSATTTYAYGAVQNRSDERDKTDISDTALGLSFIEKLRPVEYRWDYREKYKELNLDENGNHITDTTGAPVFTEYTKDGSKKGTRLHQGLIAQEVKAVMEELGIDFGGYQDHSIAGGDDVLSIGYTELIPPLIKAIQELTARIEVLENK